MKTLYVGCRVRILYSENIKGLEGETGTIVGTNDEPCPLLGEHGRWVVSVDKWGSATCPDIVYVVLPDRILPMWNCLFCPYGHQLEPILPDLLETVATECNELETV